MSDRHSGGRITDIAFSRDGRRLATAGADGWVVLWDLPTRQWIGLPVDVETIAPGTRRALGVLSLAFHPDGRTLAIASAHQVSLVDVETRSLRGVLNTDAGAVSVAYSPDGGSVAIGQDNRSATRWSTAGLQPVGPPMSGADSYVYRLAYSLDGRYLVAGSHTVVVAWDARTGRPLGPPLTGGSGFALSPDGATVATYPPNSSELYLWSTRWWSGAPLTQSQRRCHGQRHGFFTRTLLPRTSPVTTRCSPPPRIVDIRPDFAVLPCSVRPVRSADEPRGTTKRRLDPVAARSIWMTDEATIASV